MRTSPAVTRAVRSAADARAGRPAEPATAWLAVLLPTLPVVLFRVIPDIAAMATSPTAALRGVALHAGLFGYVGFATSVVLGARFGFIERAFGGLDRMYRFHRRLGVAVAGLLVIHVGSVLAVQVASDAGIVTLLRPDAGWRVFAGVLAFAGLATVLTLTAVVRLDHERFMQTHRVLGLVFAVGAAHTLRVPAFTAQSSWLNGYLIAITLVGAAAWLYRSGLGRTLVRRHWYEVARIRTLHPTITELTLEPLDEPLDFRPGQLVFVAVDDDAVGRELHPFSITSAPGERTLRLVIKAVGDFTGRVPGVTPGSVCKVEGPYGTFWRSGATAARQIWIAGGIGITPFLSMARSLPDRVAAVDMYYCTEDAETAVFIDELYGIADRHPTMRVIPVAADALGFLTADDVQAASGNVSRAHIFLCGPPAMVDTLTAQLRARGVAADRLHFEDFRLRGR